MQAAATEAQQILAAGRDLASKYAPWDSIKTAIAALPDSQTKDSLTVLVGKTEREISKGEQYVEGLQQNVERWFEEAMDRFSGWV